AAQHVLIHITCLFIEADLFRIWKHLFGADREAPHTSWIGRNDRSIHLGIREYATDPLVSLSHHILMEDRRLALTREDTAIFQSFVHILIEACLEQLYSWSDRIGRIDDDDVICCFTLFDELYSITIVKLNARILFRASGNIWHELLTSTHDYLVDLDHV